MDIVRIMIVAVGGQGNLLMGKVMGEAALSAGVPIRMSEVHGMAQRGGIVESTILLGDANSTIISDGEVDLLTGFEPSETLRAMKKCNKESLVISNTTPIPPFTAAIGMGVYPDIKECMTLIRSRVAELIDFDASSLAMQAGSFLALNMVMLGALVKTGRIPFSDGQLKQTIRDKTKESFLEMNLKAFELGYAAVS
ncbi:MAG: indolepyruvate oxidoreductase subunit beta [Deltaproteobacteria bacterium]|nr:indolepyruvate oxidoreductase subunit beta [Deltaproteobacteria bacterium]